MSRAVVCCFTLRNSVILTSKGGGPVNLHGAGGGAETQESHGGDVLAACEREDGIGLAGMISRSQDRKLPPIPSLLLKRSCGILSALRS